MEIGSVATKMNGFYELGFRTVVDWSTLKQGIGCVVLDVHFGPLEFLFSSVGIVAALFEHAPAAI